MATATSTTLTTKRGKVRKMPWHRANDPTPEQIAAACAKIQAGWSEATRQQRLVAVDRVEWRPPMFAESELPLEVSRDF